MKGKRWALLAIIFVILVWAGLGYLILEIAATPAWDDKNIRFFFLIPVALAGLSGVRVLIQCFYHLFKKCPEGTCS
jgi:hypothetical protein